jgi:hypothetical protein
MRALPRHRGAIIEATVPVGADGQASAMLVLREDDNIVWDSLTLGTYPTYVPSELTDVTVHFAGIGARPTPTTPAGFGRTLGVVP